MFPTAFFLSPPSPSSPSLFIPSSPQQPDGKIHRCRRRSAGRVRGLQQQRRQNPPLPQAFSWSGSRAAAAATAKSAAGGKIRRRRQKSAAGGKNPPPPQAFGCSGSSSSDGKTHRRRRCSAGRDRGQQPPTAKPTADAGVQLFGLQQRGRGQQNGRRRSAGRDPAGRGQQNGRRCSAGRAPSARARAANRPQVVQLVGLHQQRRQNPPWATTKSTMGDNKIHRRRRCSAVRAPSARARAAKRPQMFSCSGSRCSAVRAPSARARAANGRRRSAVRAPAARAAKRPQVVRLVGGRGQQQRGRKR